MTRILWTPAEDVILSEIYRSGRVVDQISRLPGRTHRACIQRAVILGLSKAKPSLMWSAEEDALIRAGYAAGTPVKQILRDLPGRTDRATKSRAVRLGLSGKFKGKTGSDYSWIEAGARRLLDDGMPMTCNAIAEALGASKPGTVHMLRRVHGKSFYIAGWERARGTWAAMWMVGKKQDAPRPIPETNAVRCRRARARRRIRTGGFNPFATLAMQVAA